jgi:hypothetical protein
MDKQKDNPKTQDTQAPDITPLCSCIKDPFLDLPPELRPRARKTMDGLRKVTCPGCGLVYSTNRKTDLCLDCEKKGVRPPGE